MVISGKFLEIGVLLEQFLFSSSASSELSPKPFNAKLTSNDDMLMKSVFRRRIMDVAILSNLIIDDLRRFLIFRLGSVIWLISLLPFG